MTPIGAGAAALIPARQLSADGAGYRRRQRLGAHFHPSLQMAGAGVNHYVGLTAMGAHGIQHGWRGLVQIHENVAGAIGKGLGLKVHIISVTVARAQKFYDRFPTKLSRGPQPGARESSAGVMVNQADEVALPRHGRELAVNGFERKRQSAIQTDSCPRPLRRLGWGVGSERKGAPYGETLQATGRTTRIFNRPKRVCADALPTNSVASALPHPEARFLGGHHQPTMASATGYGKGDISTLLEKGHFYFALTGTGARLTNSHVRGRIAAISNKSRSAMTIRYLSWVLVALMSSRLQPLSAQQDKRPVLTRTPSIATPGWYDWIYDPGIKPAARNELQPLYQQLDVLLRNLSAVAGQQAQDLAWDLLSADCRNNGLQSTRYGYAVRYRNRSPRECRHLCGLTRSERFEYLECDRKSE